MTVSTQKSWWWFALASCIGVALFLCGLASESLRRGDFTDGINIVVAILVFEAGVGLVAIYQLKRCYVDEPANLPGRWQLSLGDLLSIVFFAGVCMSFFAATPREQFFYRGVPMSLALAMWYTVALLAAAKTDPKNSGLIKWTIAIFYLVISLYYTAIAAATQILLICLLIGVFVVVFR